MDIQPDLRATLTLTQTEWSGWGPRGYSIHTWAKLRVVKGTVLGPAILHKAEPEGMGFDAFRYEIEVERIVGQQVGFAFQKLVIKNPDGTLNLTLPNFGRFYLSCGQTKQLATPTMDSGISVTVELHEVVPLEPEPVLY